MNDPILLRGYVRHVLSASRRPLDEAVIRFCFGEGVEPLAYFGLPAMERENARDLRESAGFLSDRGALVNLDTIADRLGIELTTNPDAALHPAPAPNNRHASNPPASTAEPTTSPLTSTVTSDKSRETYLASAPPSTSPATQSSNSGYSPDQNRAPKGQQNGGRWIKELDAEIKELGPEFEHARRMLEEDLEAAGIASDKDHDRICDKLRERLKVASPVNARTKILRIAGLHTPADESAIVGNIQQVLDMLPRAIADQLPMFRVHVVDKSGINFAGGYDEKARVLMLNRAGTGLSRDNIFHELGHYIHYHGPAYIRAGVESHFRKRTAGEPIQNNGEKTAGILVEFKKDKLATDYAGRIYPSEKPLGKGTEIPSVYLEELSDGFAGLRARPGLVNHRNYRNTMAVALAAFYHGRTRQP